MKTGGKTMFVLAACGIIFAAGALGMLYYQSKDANALIEEKKAGKSEMIDSLLTLNSATLKTFVSEFSAREDIETLVRKGVPKNGAPRIILPLNSYNAYAAVVYGKDFQPVATALDYSEKVGIADPEKIFFSSATMIADIEKNKVSRSFSILEGKLIEIFASAVSPKSAFMGDGKPEGYFLAFTVWDDNTVSSLSKVLGVPAALSFDGKEPSAQPEAPGENYFTVKKDLLNLEGKPVAQIYATYPLGGVKSFAKKTMLFIGIMALAAFVILLLVSSLLFSWTVSPFKKMLAAFKNKDAGSIEELKDRQDEFGEMGRIVGGLMDSGPCVPPKDELKTPLASVKEAINILSEELADDLNDEQSQFLEMARKNTEKMETILNSASPQEGGAAGNKEE